MHRRRQSVRITPLGYIVLSIIIIVMLVGIYFIIWSMGGNNKATLENKVSNSIDITPTPSIPPVSNTATPTASPSATPAVQTPASQAPSTTPKLDDTPTPSVKMPSPAQVKSALDGKLTNGGVVLRKGPSGTYDILGKYPTGTQLKIYALEDEYYFVMIVKENKYGYMAAKFIEKNGLLPGESASPTPEVPSGVIAGKVSASTLALRSGPSKDSKAVGQAERGDAVYIYFKVDEFYYVEILKTGLKCYAFAEYVQPEKTGIPTGTPVP
ncbi:MAG: hypothetical protein RRZ24_08135 [Clostridia bacterium]